VGVQLLRCWDGGFESSRGHGCLGLVSVLFCQVEVSMSGRSLVHIVHMYILLTLPLWGDKWPLHPVATLLPAYPLHSCPPGHQKLRRQRKFYPLLGLEQSFLCVPTHSPVNKPTELYISSININGIIAGRKRYDEVQLHLKIYVCYK